MLQANYKILLYIFKEFRERGDLARAETHTLLVLRSLGAIC